MPYKTIDCECGEEIETFISQSEESDGRESCDNCTRMALYESPPSKGITSVTFRKEAGSVGDAV